WLQRGSALAFGTRIGRWFTLFLALPVLAAFATVVFVLEMLHLAHIHPHLGRTRFGIAVAALSVFYLLLLHLPVFRTLVMNALRWTWAALRAVFIDLPVAFVRLPLVRDFLGSPFFLFTVRYVLVPLPAAALAWTILWAGGVGSEGAAYGAGAALLAASLFLNSRFGRDIEELATDWLVRHWEYYRDL